MPYSHIEKVAAPSTALVTSVAGVLATGWVRLINTDTDGWMLISVEIEDLNQNFLGYADVSPVDGGWAKSNDKWGMDFSFSMPNFPVRLLVFSWSLQDYGWRYDEFGGAYLVSPAEVLVAYKKV